MAVLDTPSNERRTRALVAFVAVALIVAAACVWLLAGTRITPAAAPIAGPAGIDTVAFTTADGTQGQVTLVSIRRTAEKAPDSRLAAGPTYGSFLIADFTVTVTGGQILATAGNFQVEMDGRVYPQNPVPTPTQISATARPGHAAEGPVGFDAPVGKLRITFNDNQGRQLAAFDVDG